MSLRHALVSVCMSAISRRDGMIERSIRLTGFSELSNVQYVPVFFACPSSIFASHPEPRWR